jgi:hypothetical protein
LASFVKFILKYYIAFEAIVNGIVSLISFSVCALLVYRKPTDFSMLILYVATLPLEFMISSRFWLNFCGLLSIVSCHLHTEHMRKPLSPKEQSYS